MTSVEPLDSGQIAFALSFDGQEFEIDPPIGWDSIKIGLKRGDKFARHIDLAISDIEFWNRPIKFGHQFDRLVQAHKTTADESKIELIIYVDSAEWLRSELVMSDCITDRENYFKTKLKGSSLRQLIEDRKDIKISIFGNETPDGNATDPVPYQTVKLDPKLIRTITAHTTGDNNLNPVSTPIVYDVGGGNTVFPGGILSMGNPWGALTMEQSDESSSYYVPTNQAYVNAGGNNVPDTYISGGLSGTENFWFSESSNIDLKISDLSISVNLFENPLIGVDVQIALITYDNENRDNVVSKSYIPIYSGSGKTHNINTAWSGNILQYSRLIYEFRVNATGFSPRKLTDEVVISGGVFEMSIINIFKSTTVRFARLFDAGRRVIDAISENTATSLMIPIAIGSLYYDSFVTSGARLRGFDDTDFVMSFQDFKKFVQNALNCDIQINDTLFLGHQRDFYQDVEIARIPFKPTTDSYEISLNKELIKNQLLFGYDTYEKDEYDTLDAFHTDSEWYIKKRNEGKIDSKINFILDGYSIEYARRQGITKEPTTAKEKDDKIYLVDTVIRNGVRSNRQNEGFSMVSGIFSPETAYNLIYQIKRLLTDNYSERLLECSQVMDFGQTSGMTEIAKLTEFKANSGLTTVSNIAETTSKIIIDNKNIIVSDLENKPLITPFIYKFQIAIRYKFINLVNLYKMVVEQMGYITFYDDKKEIKVYPFEMDYDWNKEVLTITAEQKNEN